MICRRHIVPYLFAGLVIAGHGCRVAIVPEPPVSLPPPEIVYTTWGGFVGGGPHDSLYISLEGLASLTRDEFTLYHQLSGIDHRSLADQLPDMGTYDDWYPGNCIDDITYRIEIRRDSIGRTVSVAGCALSVPPGLGLLVRRLSGLCDSIYETGKPWRGLDVSFSLEKEIYRLGEPVGMKFHIENNTDKVRMIPFRHQRQAEYWISQDNNTSLFSFTNAYPDYDTASPSQMVLEPYERRDITAYWDYAGEARPDVTPGDYRAVLSLRYFSTPASLWFEIVDPAIPVGGALIPDYRGEQRHVDRYNFALSVRNWTSAPVTVKFPNSQKISVDLYMQAQLDTYKHFYHSPEVEDGIGSEITLAPGATDTLSYTALKDSLHLPYSFNWVDARVKLLTSDFSFERSGRVGINKIAAR